MMKKFWIITLFPDYFNSFQSMGKASTAFGKNLELKIINLRDFSDNKYGSVDDYPYGGGPGMVIKANVLKNALDSICESNQNIKEKLRVIYPNPRGKVWNRDLALSFAQDLRDENDKRDYVFICGRYEGLDERFIEMYVDDHFSLGDYILTGGEIPVMAILDSSVRFIEGTLGNDDSSKEDSFENGQLEHPHYTRPKEFEGVEVPKILLSGNHALIKNFRDEESQRVTSSCRPDLSKGTD